MRNSSRSRYAVAALVDLTLSKTTRPVALAEIAQRQSVSVSYLEQVFALLRQNCFVNRLHCALPLPQTFREFATPLGLVGCFELCA